MSETPDTPKPKMGRPVLYPDDPLHPVTIWVPQSVYARAVSIARQCDVSASRVLRMTLMRHLPPK